jgi:uncharacterized membrane protein YidH (DUF202 family)
VKSMADLTSRPGDRPFDQGLQPERTALAWRRTCLSLALGALIAVRVLPHFWGPAGLIVAGAGVILSIVMLVLAHQRYRTHHDRLTSGRFEHLGLPDGTLPAMLTATTVVAGILAVVLTVTIRNT